MWSAVAAKAAAAPAAAAPAAPAAASAALAAAPAAPAAPEVPAAAPQEATRPDQDAASGPEQEADEPPPSSLSGGRAEGLKALVVDTAALLQLDLRLDCLAPELYTVPEVLREVRSKQAREQLALVPYELHEREPSDAAMRFGALRKTAAGPGSLPGYLTVGACPRAPLRVRSDRVCQEDRRLCRPLGGRPAGARAHVHARGRADARRLAPAPGAAQGTARAMPPLTTPSIG